MIQKPAGRTWLNVSFKDKDKAKARGARFDLSKKRWYVPEGSHLSPFLEWMSFTSGDFEKRLSEAKRKYAERLAKNG